VGPEDKMGWDLSAHGEDETFALCRLQMSDPSAPQPDPACLSKHNSDEQCTKYPRR
jgi:hypothetical protein